ncbi:hypothetical protein BI364_11670 [Acidihalobacter yilgarnensis]|uniref:Sulfotransferase n=2 Tax=Acidihalobacter yilgarnensis TaxID=2819280 RepID=A0A1D8IQ28_9GAMM|nr:hypothetical protein BI364_11670 [Acidihalobacter yilgarnensis]
MGKILDSHPQTLDRHEPDSVRRLSMPLFPALADADVDSAEIHPLFTDMPNMRKSKIVGKMPLVPKDYRFAPAFALKRAGILGAKFVGRVSSGFPVPFLPRAERRGHGRIVWTSAESLGRWGILLDVLKDAVAIHLLRHPCDHIASVLRGEAARTLVDNRPSSDDYGLLEMLLATGPARRRHGLSLVAQSPLGEKGFAADVTG